ncbi:hypothetical protein HPC50_03215 [Corallococcus exiguus]|uniref:hypothetical protein n=1 Tax=Corallococcus TaxID=83461 RepID=UPI0011C3859A|nr:MULTISPECIES: hypothetical protein [Corallococcus]NPC46080.1 hypothetical protein [Corallococcus exiguus]
MTMPPTETTPPSRAKQEVAAPPATGNKAVDEAQAFVSDAFNHCDNVTLNTAYQQLLITKIATRRKNLGLLATTIVGVAGSIVTAALLGSKAASDGNSEKATIVGASSAGATAITGVVSIFIVGSGADDRVKQMSDNKNRIDQEVDDLSNSCKDINANNAAQCTQKAKRVKNRCGIAETQLPYEVENQPSFLPTN